MREITQCHEQATRLRRPADLIDAVISATIRIALYQQRVKGDRTAAPSLRN
jgi:hypothetical protein